MMGPGWPTPYNVIVVNRNRPITTPALLAASTAADADRQGQPVDSVAGPGSINSTSSSSKSFGPQLAHSAKISDKSKKDLLKLINGLGQAGSGSPQLQSGLEQASSGRRPLHTGSGQAQSGAGQLHPGSAQAQAGSAEPGHRPEPGAVRRQALKTGAGQALSGSAAAGRLGLAQGPAGQSVPALSASASVTAGTKSRCRRRARARRRAPSPTSARRWRALQSMTRGKTDPQLRPRSSALQRAERFGFAAFRAASAPRRRSASGRSGLAGVIA